MNTNRVHKHQVSFIVFSLIILSASICSAYPTAPKNTKTLAETQISGVINIYTPVVAIENSCSPIITVENGLGFNSNDKVLIIQMQGATITPDNTPDYGIVVSSDNAGNYEFARIKSINGNSIVLQNSLLRKYSVAGKVQLVRVPEYQNATVTDTLTGLPWNGKSGGVIVLSVSEILTLKSNIVGSQLGFRGAILRNATNFPATHTPDYVGSNSSPHLYAPKGEGIAGYGIEPMTNGKGAPANGGGGGNNHNAGGGGGANIGAGGTGGYGWNSSWSGDNKLSRGIGGHKLFDLDNRLFFGGGGGSGHTNQSGNGSGGNGGGIVIVVANVISSSSQSILSEGGQGGEAPEDGAGGGGGGGAIIVSANSINGTLNLNSRGGNGGNIVNFQGEIGPGGGGGGGGVYFSFSTQPLGVTTNVSGGISGKMMVKGTTFGASDGGAGGVFFNLVIPQNLNNAVVANAGNDHQICMNDSTTIGAPGITGYTYSWQPTVGLQDPNSSQTSAGPLTTTRYILTATNGSGCSDYDTVVVTIGTIAATVSPETAICAGNKTLLHASGGTSYEWFPATGLDNPRTANPLASPSQTTLYGVIVTQGNCTDTAYTTVRILPAAISHGMTTITMCNRNGTHIGYPSVVGCTYQWNPVDGLDSPASSQTNARPSNDTRYILTVVNEEGCVGYDTVDVQVSFDNKLEILATNTDSVLVFDSTFVGVKNYRYIKLFNRDSVLPYYLSSASMKHNIYFSIPQSQLPLIIQPLDTAYLQVCFAPEHTSIQTDTLILYDTACTDRWIPMRAAGVLSFNPALTRCRVPVYITANNQGIVFSITNLYPQPANNHVKVDFELSGSSDIISTPTNAVLRDILGNTVAIALPVSIRKFENSLMGHYTFQTEHLTTGVYSLAVGIGKDVKILQIVVAR